MLYNRCTKTVINYLFLKNIKYETIISYISEQNEFIEKQNRNY